MPPEANPFLGVRGIRLALARPEMLATQLRAILRVAAEHPLKVMLPMVATLDELVAARARSTQPRVDTGVDAPLEFGIMVEVPAAALTAARLAEHVDFFSLGTNDLTQYTMAAERGDERLAPLLDRPAARRAPPGQGDGRGGGRARGLGRGVRRARRRPGGRGAVRRPGVTELSMAPALVPEAKAALRGVDLGQAQAAAARGARGRQCRRRPRARAALLVM